MRLLTAPLHWSKGWIAGGLASAALLFAGPVAADEVTDLLDTMAAAAREQSYQGDFVYERSGSFSTHRVWRRVDDTVVERLLRTDGAPQEWLRRDGHLQCSTALNAGEAWEDRALLSRNQANLHQWYTLQVLGKSRVANRPVTVVAVTPRDPFRYAYELYLDSDSGLLLQSLLINEEGSLLERFQFTNLRLGPVAAENLAVAGACLPVSEKPSVGMTVDDGWLPAWLPPGFAPVRREIRRSEADDVPIYTQVFTDGLARFTVFVEPLTGSRVANDLRAQLGPTVAVSRKVVLPEGSYLATVVGELPPMAAERIAASLSPDFDPDTVTDNTH